MLLGVAPAAALADTFCVQDPACEAAGGTDKASLQAALTSANDNGGASRDLIQIGATTLTENAIDSNDNVVDIRGRGRDQTTINGTGSGTTLTIGEETSTVADLAVNASTGANSFAMSLRGTAERLNVGRVSGGTGDATGAVLLGSPTFRDSGVTLPILGGGGSGSTFGVSLGPGVANTQTVEDVEVQADFGVDQGGPGTANVSRIRVFARTGVRVFPGDMNLRDAQIRLDNTDFAVGMWTATNTLPGPWDVDLNARHVTVVGQDSDNSAGLRSTSIAAAAGDNTQVDIRNTIIRNVARSIERGSAGDDATDTINIAIDYSNYDPSTVSSTGPALGSTTEGPNSLNVDPLFVDPGAGDFRLRSGSPVIDRGDAAAVVPGELDLDRNPRVRDGDGNGSELPDMGAFEFQPPSPDPDAGLLPGACANPRTGTEAAEMLAGTPAGDNILGLGGGDLLFGFQGDDCLDGGDGSDRMDGGDGADRLTGGLGNDRLFGGAGADTLAGGRGRDRLTGGTDRDSLSGGPHADTINAVDRRRETVSCGSGRDRARVDRRDRVRRCERVRRVR